MPRSKMNPLTAERVERLAALKRDREKVKRALRKAGLEPARVHHPKDGHLRVCLKPPIGPYLKQTLVAQAQEIARLTSLREPFEVEVFLEPTR